MLHSPITSATGTPSNPAPPPQGYDGTSPFPPDGPAPARDGGERLYVTVTAVIVLLPFVAIGLAGWLLWGRLIHPADIVLALVLYTITGLGVTVGFHRGLTHGGYRAIRPVRIALAVAGSMSFQGDVIGWVATHRRHHAFTDRPGDPHSPYRYGAHLRGQLRGLLHAHVGWLFRNGRTPADRYAPDLLADRDILPHSRLRSSGRYPHRRPRLPGAVRPHARPAVRGGLGHRRYVAVRRDRPAVGGTCAHRAAPPRHLERELPLSPDR
jgi:stearoyl-CoA desaturase (delta-9 desaturase)